MELELGEWCLALCSVLRITSVKRWCSQLDLPLAVLVENCLWRWNSLNVRVCGEFWRHNCCYCRTALTSVVSTVETRFRVLSATCQERQIRLGVLTQIVDTTSGLTAGAQTRAEKLREAQQLCTQVCHPADTPLQTHLKAHWWMKPETREWQWQIVVHQCDSINKTCFFTLSPEEYAIPLDYYNNKQYKQQNRIANVYSNNCLLTFTEVSWSHEIATKKLMTFVFNGKVRWLPVAKFANGGEREMQWESDRWT